MIDLVITRLQVIFDTAASAAASLGGAPTPVQMHMHGSEGVTPALHFDITQGGGLAVHDCTAQAVGDLHQLTVWVEPAMVCTSCYRLGPPPCWLSPGLQLKQAIQSHNSCTKALVRSSWSHQHVVLSEACYLCNVNRQQLVLTCVIGHETLPLSFI